MPRDQLLKFAEAIAEAKSWAQDTEDDEDSLDGLLEQLDIAGRAASEFMEEYGRNSKYPGLMPVIKKMRTACSQLDELERSPDPLVDAVPKLDAIVLPLQSEIDAAKNDFKAEMDACDYDSEW